MVHIASRLVPVTIVELKGGHNDVDPIDGDEPTCNTAACVIYHVIYTETDNNGTNINPSKGLL